MAGERPALGDVTMYVLAALAGGERHGYAIVQQVHTLSDDRVRLGTGTLYGALERMLEAGQVVVAREETVAGRFRRYYRITPSGRGDLDAELERREADLRSIRAQVLGAI
jgi:DNA-binding PadR family transcriptional regulator